MPRTITHEGALQGVDREVAAFWSEIEFLQPKLGAVLIQLPPSLDFQARTIRKFLQSLPRLAGCHLVCEPRHPTWFTGTADAVLQHLRVTRVAADPTNLPAGGSPGGDDSFRYFRWHGSPDRYYSSYTPPQLQRFAMQVDEAIPTWCVFDNTARYAAWDNARSFGELVNRRRFRNRPRLRAQ